MRNSTCRPALRHRWTAASLSLEHRCEPAATQSSSSSGGGGEAAASLTLSQLRVALAGRAGPAAAAAAGLRAQNCNSVHKPVCACVCLTWPASSAVCLSACLCVCERFCQKQARYSTLFSPPILATSIHTVQLANLNIHLTYRYI